MFSTDIYKGHRRLFHYLCSLVSVREQALQLAFRSWARQARWCRTQHWGRCCMKLGHNQTVFLLFVQRLFDLWITDCTTARSWVSGMDNASLLATCAAWKPPWVRCTEPLSRGPTSRVISAATAVLQDTDYPSSPAKSAAVQLLSETAGFREAVFRSRERDWASNSLGICYFSQPGSHILPVGEQGCLCISWYIWTKKIKGWITKVIWVSKDVLLSEAAVYGVHLHLTTFVKHLSAPFGNAKWADFMFLLLIERSSIEENIWTSCEQNQFL